MASPLAASATTHSALQDICKGCATEFGACVGPMIEDANNNSIPMKAIGVLYATLMGLEQTLTAR
jgi:ketopantoate reductase